MEQEKYIKKCYIKKGESISSIAKKTGHDWRTVKKYADKEDYSQSITPRTESKSKLDKVKPIIDKWLEYDSKMPPKQRHTAIRIYNRLREEYGEIFNASLRTVSTYVAAKKREIYKETGAYLPLLHHAGEAQADFGELTFAERGVATKGYFLTLSFPYSNASYCQIFKGQNLECLLTGLKNIFEYISGVPTIIWFDNLSPVVTSIKKNGERLLTEGFERFSMHFGFDHNFCNPNSGHEKGNVEAKVGYNRRNYFVPMPEISSINEYNRYLLTLGDKDMNRVHYKKGETIERLFQEDKEALLPLPKYEYEVYRLEKFKTDLYGMVTIKQQYHYSVSPSYAEKQVWVKLTADKVTILDEDYKVLITHERLYGDKKESMDWTPYIELMSRRPNALKYTAFYEEVPKSIKEYFDSCKLEEKKIGLKVLGRMLKEISMGAAANIFHTAFIKGLKDEDSLLAIYYRAANNAPTVEDMSLPSYVPEIEAYTTNIASYDSFLKGSEPKL